MKEVTLILDFKTGIGDLYVGTLEAIYYANKLKEYGIECNLKFNGGFKVKYIDKIDLNEIYRMEEFNIFKSISNINLNTFNLKDYNSLPLIKKSDTWMAFSHHAIPEIPIPNFKAYSGNKILFPYNPPIFVDRVYQISNDFLSNKPDSFDFIQFRTRNAITGLSYEALGKNNYIESHDCARKVVEKIYDFISSSSNSFYIGSNDQYFIDTIKPLTNTFYFNFTNLDLFTNDYDYYYHTQKKNLISREMFLNRFYENLAEFVSITNAKNYYYFNTVCWVSNFLSYALVHNKNNFVLNRIYP